MQEQIGVENLGANDGGGALAAIHGRSRATDRVLRRWPGSEERRPAGMLTVAWIRAACLLLVVSAAGWADEPGTAKPDAAKPQSLLPSGPLAILNIASMDRVLSDIGYMFDAADRSDMKEVAEQQLDRAGQLEGLDRTRPLGMMVYLKQGLPPQPEVVGYFPVTNIRDLSRTLELGPVSVQPVPDTDGRYTLKGPNRSFQVRMLHGYAFVSNDGEVLDRDLGDPVEQVRALSDRYDVALQFDITKVPAGIRQLFMTFLKSSSAAELQQRDGESEGAYRIRKANGESTMILLEQLVTECDALTLGFDASEERKSATFDIDIRATTDSTFSQYLMDIAGRRSFFECLLREDSPLSLSVSWSMHPREQKSFQAALAAGETALKSRLDEPADVDGPVHTLFRSLDRTVAQRHLDLFLQFLPSDSTKMVLIGAMRMEEADRFSGAMRELLGRVADADEFREVELDMASHAGITFHRLQGAEIRRQDERIYGERPSLYVGAGRNSIWFGVGGDDALESLRQAIDGALAELQNPSDRSPAAPFQIVSHIRPWMDLQEPEEELSIRREVAEESFRGGSDQLRLEFRPTDEGGRLRLHFEEAFIRFIGKSISTRYDLQQL